jgi:monovalent cation:H+ antiporter-2, CPA2 family
MHGEFLTDLLIVLGTAAVTTVVFQALRQPVALGYILAGLLIGPYVPIPLVADAALVATLSELGVILLMFSIGLEFSIRTIAKVGLPAGMTAALEVGLMVSLGYLIGLAFGWTGTECLFLGACLGISSTMLVAKAFEESKLSGGFVELVFAILVFEDLIAILLLAILTAVASGSGLSGGELIEVVGKLGGFLLAMLVVGLMVVPRAIRMIANFGRSETLLIAAMVVCFGMAVLAQRAGYSVALGAFMAGMMVAESGRAHDVDVLIRPFRDVFAAIFFVSVGMTIDPALIAENWLPVVVLTFVVLIGKATGVTVGSFLAGNGLRRSVRAGISLAQIGEFSFIIAALGSTSGATRDFLLPIAVAVSCLTAFATPWLIRFSDQISSAVDRGLPGRLQTFVTFYGSWIERLRSTTRRESLWTRMRSPLVILVFDAALVVTIVIGTSLATPRLIAEVTERTGLDAGAAKAVVYGGAALLASLFVIGVVRCVRRLARILAAEVIPQGEDGKLDLGTAPRRVLFLTLELAIVLVVGVPLAALIQPFVPGGGALLAIPVLLIAFMVWRATQNLHGHVRAGSELIVEALRHRSRAPTETEAEHAQPPGLDVVEAMLPGFAGLAPLTLDPASPAIGRSLADLNLRAMTGASVLAITRVGDGGGTAMPSPSEPLRAGDTLALAGSDEAVAAARAILTGAPAAE